MKRYAMLFAGCLLLFACPLAGMADTTWVPPGPVSGVWGPWGTPYVLLGRVEVPDGRELTILQGVEVLYADSFTFDVYGVINALGTPVDSIFFRPLRRTGWRGNLFLRFTDGLCRFHYVVFERGTAYGPEWLWRAHGGGLYSRGADLEMEHCVFRNNRALMGGGFYFDGPTNSRFSHCVFQRNASRRGGGMLAYMSAGVFTECTFADNTAENGGGAVLDLPTELAFRHCRFVRNVALNNGGGLDIFSCTNIQSPPNLFDRCTIAGNIAHAEGGGIRMGTMGVPDSSVRFQFCTVYDNILRPTGFGTGLYAERVYPRIERCTFAFNAGEIMTPEPRTGTLHFRECAPVVNSTIVAYATSTCGIFYETMIGIPTASVFYCDVWGSTQPPFCGTIPIGLGVLDTVNVNGDSSDHYMNIQLDPLFADAENRDFHLLRESPCIDAGDPQLLPDPDSTVADIGAFYYHQLPPLPPSELVVRLVTESMFPPHIQLHWRPVTHDIGLRPIRVDRYAIYRWAHWSARPPVEPFPPVLIGFATDTTFVDWEALNIDTPRHCYFVTAVTD